MVDLHIHSNFSDGQYSPQDILTKVQEKGITEFALTDHDNIDGAVIMQNLVKDKNIKYHVGVEISSRIEEMNVNIHLLCYDFDVLNRGVIDVICELKQKRLKKLDLMIDFIEQNFHYKITNEEKEKLLKENNIVGKPHLYALLSGKINLSREVYYNTMNNLKVPESKVEALKVLKTFHNAGGVVVLAHPKEIEEEYNVDAYDVIKYLVNAGLDGVETKHSKHNVQDYLRYSKYAKEFNLFQTQGSDFHGEKVKPNVILGKCEK